MSKRFTDDEKWDKVWLRKLSPERKLIFVYLLDKCDRAGFWEIDYDRMCFDLGLQRDFADPLEGLKDIIVSEQYAMIVDFIPFQYPKGLSRKNPAHKRVISILEKMVLIAPFESLVSPFLGAMEEDKEEDKDKAGDKEKETAKILASLFMKRIAAGYGQKLTTTERSTANGIYGLIKKGVPPVQIQDAIIWLSTVNQMKGEYKMVVLSGNALAEKWDRIQQKMSEPVPAASQSNRKGPW